MRPPEPVQFRPVGIPKGNLMALQFKCEKGHSYVAGDLPDVVPVGAPRCPFCRLLWYEGRVVQLPDNEIEVDGVRYRPLTAKELARSADRAQQFTLLYG
jgi:hypothetical protein